MDLSKRTVTRYDALPEGVQPPIMLDEFGECEEAARRSPAFREACKKRGIADLSLVMIDAWSAGHYGNEPPEDRGKRLCRALCWVRSEPSDNGYARPIENLVVVIDLNRKEVLRVEDGGAIPLPPQSGNWARQYNKETRTGLKPLEVTQSEGPSFGIRGHEVSWQKWDLRVGFNPREGLVLYQMSYDGRPVLYRASISEMLVPYADPKVSAYRKNAFDLGEYGVGMMANSLAIGCDCLGTIRYFDGHLADSRGRVSRSRTPSASTKKTSASSGSTPTGASTSRRSDGRGDCRSRWSPPWETTTMASTGTSIRTGRSRWRSSSRAS